MKRMVYIALVGMALATAPVQGQDAVGGERTVVNFSDPSRPGLVSVNWIAGGITVRTHAGPDVVIESRVSENRNRRPPSPRADGLRRIDNNPPGMTVEERNNVITINRVLGTPGDLEIQVPAKVNLNIKGLNGKAIVVEDVDGEIEVSTTNSDVRLSNVAGSVVAASTNGRVIVSLRELTPDRSMSFASMNGDVDLTLPPSAKANLKMRADNGASFSDFDVTLRAPAENVRTRNRTTDGTINGGGPDLTLRTLNGNIYVRKAK